LGHFHYTLNGEENNNRYPDDQDHCRVDMSEELKKSGLEKAYRLLIVVDLMRNHGCALPLEIQNFDNVYDFY
jgi:hypothetical protein